MEISSQQILSKADSYWQNPDETDQDCQKRISKYVIPARASINGKFSGSDIAQWTLYDWAFWAKRNLDWASRSLPGIALTYKSPSSLEPSCIWKCFTVLSSFSTISCSRALVRISPPFLVISSAIGWQILSGKFPAKRISFRAWVSLHHAMHAKVKAWTAIFDTNTSRTLHMRHKFVIAADCCCLDVRCNFYKYFCSLSNCQTGVLESCSPSKKAIFDPCRSCKNLFNAISTTCMESSSGCTEEHED